jgi:hypothetical protein
MNTNDVAPLCTILDLIELLLALPPDFVVADTIKRAALAPLRLGRNITRSPF